MMFYKIKRYYYDLFHPVIGEVWQLHRVTDQVSNDETQRLYEVSPKRLENLILQYLERGYTFIPIDSISRIVTGQERHKRFVAVTLDDGYWDNYEWAYPIFQKYNIPFCIYITKDYIQNGHNNYRFLTIDQLESLANEPLCTLGCHTCSHPYLSQLSHERQIHELAFCKQWLEQIIHKPILHVAYPYGDYSPITIQIVEKLGFISATAAWGGKIRRNVEYSLYAVPRVLVTEKDIK